MAEEEGVVVGEVGLVIRFCAVEDGGGVNGFLNGFLNGWMNECLANWTCLGQKKTSGLHHDRTL